MEAILQRIVDKHLQNWIEMGLNKLPIPHIPKDMQGPIDSEQSEWKTWLPIPSLVTDEQMSQLESQLGYHLPYSYRQFLQYKHFYELHIGQVSFLAHPSYGWQSCILEAVFEGYPSEYLIDKGYMPFASYSDWGLMCFDLNQQEQNSECPIVLWDHEIADSVTRAYNNFNEMLSKLDEENENNIT